MFYDIEMYIPYQYFNLKSLEKGRTKEGNYAMIKVVK